MLRSAYKIKYDYPHFGDCYTNRHLSIHLSQKANTWQGTKWLCIDSSFCQVFTLNICAAETWRKRDRERERDKRKRRVHFNRTLIPIVNFG